MESESSKFAKPQKPQISIRNAALHPPVVFISAIRIPYLKGEDRGKTATILAGALRRFGNKLYHCTVQSQEGSLSIEFVIDGHVYEDADTTREKRIRDFTDLLVRKILSVTEPKNVSNVKSEIDASENFLESQGTLWSVYKTLLADIYPFYGAAFGATYEQHVKTTSGFDERANARKEGSYFPLPADTGGRTVREIMALRAIITDFKSILERVAKSNYTSDATTQAALLRAGRSLYYWLFNRGCGESALVLLRNALVNFDIDAALLTHDSLRVKLSHGRGFVYAPRDKSKYIDLYIVADSFSNEPLPPRLDLAIGMVKEPLDKALMLLDTVLRDGRIRVTTIGTIKGDKVPAADIACGRA